MPKLEGYHLKINVWLGKDDERSISFNVAILNILVHHVINLLYYEQWTDKKKYIYI